MVAACGRSGGGVLAGRGVQRGGGLGRRLRGRRRGDRRGRGRIRDGGRATRSPWRPWPPSGPNCARTCWPGARTGRCARSPNWTAACSSAADTETDRLDRARDRGEQGDHPCLRAFRGGQVLPGRGRPPGPARGKTGGYLAPPTCRTGASVTADHASQLLSLGADLGIRPWRSPPGTAWRADRGRPLTASIAATYEGRPGRARRAGARRLPGGHPPADRRRPVRGPGVGRARGGPGPGRHARRADPPLARRHAPRPGRRGHRASTSSGSSTVFPNITEAWKTTNVVVPPMTREQLRQVINAPLADLKGIRFADGLARADPARHADRARPRCLDARIRPH